MGNRSWQDRSAEDLVDEHPATYKDIDRVMADQADLVEIVHTLRQILNYKGTDDGRRRRKKPPAAGAADFVPPAPGRAIRAMTTLENRPNTAFLVVDVQNGVVEGAHERDTVVANVGTLVEKARQEHVPSCGSSTPTSSSCRGATSGGSSPS